MKRTPEQKALAVLRKAINQIALMNEYPPAPAYYLAIQATWRKVAKAAKKAKATADELLGEEQ